MRKVLSNLSECLKGVGAVCYALAARKRADQRSVNSYLASGSPKGGHIPVATIIFLDKPVTAMERS